MLDRHDPWADRTAVSWMLPTEFSGKTWIFVAQAAILGSFGAIALILGPLFLLGIIVPANGKPGTEAGIALSVLAVPLLLVSALAIFNIQARRRPIIRFLAEGIEINQIGCSSLGDVPLLPGYLRVAQLILSREGFRQQLVFIPWQSLSGAVIVGPMMAQKLVILGDFNLMTVDGAAVDAGPETREVLKQIAFPEVAFESAIAQVATAINGYCRNPELRLNLSVGRSSL